MYTHAMKSIHELRKTSEAAAAEESGRIKELFELCSELAQQVDGLQRQLDDMRRHQTIARRSGG